MREMSVAGIPVGRLCTQQDVANAVRFFAMPESGFVTGITMSVNGGQYIH